MSDTSTRTRGASFLLALILGVGVALRLSGIQFGFPGKYRPDEEYLVWAGLAISWRDPNPHFFIYPSLWLYVLAGVFNALSCFGKALGYYPQGFQVFNDQLLWVPAYLVARVISVLVASATIWVVYKLGKLIGGPLVGLGSALLLALNFLHVKEAHFATTDAALTFWCTVSLYCMCRSLIRNSSGALLIAAFATGLAISTKYSAAPLGLPLGLTLIFFVATYRRGRWLRSFLWMSTAAASLSGLAFFLTSPYFFLDFDEVKKQYEFQIGFLTHGIGVDMPYGWRWLSDYSLPLSMGCTLLAASLVSLLVPYFYRRDRGRWLALVVLFSFVLGLGGALIRSKWLFIRYTLPMMPVLSVTVAVLLHQVSAGLAARIRSQKALVPLYSALIALCVADPAWRAVQLSKALREKDTRQFAREWMFTHVRPGTPVYYRGSFPYTRPELAPRHSYTGYEELLNTELPRPAEAYLIVDLHPIKYFSPPPSPEIAQLLASHGKLEARFSPFLSEDRTSAVFDVADAFYAPMKGFSHVSRPGPELLIYRLDFSARP